MKPDETCSAAASDVYGGALIWSCLGGQCARDRALKIYPERTCRRNREDWYPAAKPAGSAGIPACILQAACPEKKGLGAVQDAGGKTESK